MVHMIEIVRQGKVDFPHQVIVSFLFFYSKTVKRKFLKYNMVHFKHKLYTLLTKKKL